MSIKYIIIEYINFLRAECWLRHPPALLKSFERHNQTQIFMNILSFFYDNVKKCLFEKIQSSNQVLKKNATAFLIFQKIMTGSALA